MKINSAEFDSWVLNCYYAKLYPEQRLGQAFMNEFCKDESNPLLFYEVMNGKSIRIIREQYIDYTP